jgi:arsenite methyltransferase
MKELLPYGLGSPAVVRNLALCALACRLLCGLDFTTWLLVKINRFDWPALCLSFGACAKAWNSRYGKLYRCDRAIDEVARVLRPPGQVMIDDIGHASHCA